MAKFNPCLVMAATLMFGLDAALVVAMILASHAERVAMALIAGACLGGALIYGVLYRALRLP